MNSIIFSIITLLAAFLTVIITSNQGTPNFVEPISNVSVAVGRSTMLECTVNNLGNYKVAWLKVDPVTGDSTLLTIHTQILVHDSRFRVTHFNSRQWYLHIRDVKAQDNGHYMCQINTEPMISQVGYLDVHVPPSIIESETSSDVIVDEKKKLSLKCKADGYPQPTILWRREDGKDLNLGHYGGKKFSAKNYEGEYLNTTQVQRDDMGAYLCIASNGVQPSVSKRIIVKVVFQPKIKVQNQLAGASIGNDLVLECRCEASPTPQISWAKTGDSNITIMNSAKYELFEEHEGYRTKMRLKINNIQEEDFGSYKCIAKNNLGEKEGLFRVYKVEPPETPPPKPYGQMTNEKSSQRSHTNSKSSSNHNHHSNSTSHNLSSKKGQTKRQPKTKKPSEGQSTTELMNDSEGNGTSIYSLQIQNVSFTKTIVLLLIILHFHILF